MLTVVHHSADRPFVDRLRAALELEADFHAAAVAIDETHFTSVFEKVLQSSVVLVVVSPSALASFEFAGPTSGVAAFDPLLFLLSLAGRHGAAIPVLVGPSVHDAFRRTLASLDPVLVPSDDPPRAKYREIVARVARLSPKPAGDRSEGPSAASGGGAAAASVGDGADDTLIADLGSVDEIDVAALEGATNDKLTADLGSVLMDDVDVLFEEAANNALELADDEDDDGGGAAGIGRTLVEPPGVIAELLDDGGGADRIPGSRGLLDLSRVDGDVPRASPPPTDIVRFAVFAPRTIAPASSFLLDVWAHTKEQRADVVERATRGGERAEVGEQGPFEIERGLQLDVTVEIPGLRYRSRAAPLLWIGEAANASFAVDVPKSARRGRVLGSARIAHRGLQIATVHFELQVGAAVQPRGAIRTRVKRVRSVFASYASEDREEALRVRRALEPMRIDVFVDALSLRLGQRWEKELVREIRARERFYLLWSAHAAASKWVEKEWRCALAKKGLGFIDPIALADPRDVPPPKALAKLHFASDTLPALEYEAQRRRGRASKKKRTTGARAKASARRRTKSSRSRRGS